MESSLRMFNETFIKGIAAYEPINQVEKGNSFPQANYLSVPI